MIDEGKRQRDLRRVRWLFCRCSLQTSKVSAPAAFPRWPAYHNRTSAPRTPQIALTPFNCKRNLMLEFSTLFHYLFQQRLIAIHHIINHLSVADRLKMLSCAMDFGFLNEPELHRGHGAFRFSNKIDVLDCAFIESNCPVRVIMSE